MIWRSNAIPHADQPGGLIAHLQDFRHHPLDVFVRASRQDEPILQFHLGPLSVLGVFDPDLAEEVLVNKPDTYVKGTRGQRLLQVLLGDSMLTTEGDVWRVRRRLGQPHFKRSALPRYRPAMAQTANGLAERLVAADGQVVDVFEEMMALALRVACEALFGGDLGEASEEVHGALDDVLDAYMAMITLPVPNPERFPLGPSRRFRRGQRQLFDVVDRVIARRRGETDTGEDLLGDWLSAGLSDDALRSEVVTMLLAGHETTANLLTWTLALLSRYPAVRRQLEAELDPRDRSEAVDLRKLPILQGVLLESLRYIPPVWMMSRSTATTVELGGHVLPPNTFVFVCTYAMHRDARLWDNPEGFDPARWAGDFRPAHRLAFMPFGAGQRRCIGEQFALLEAAEVLAALVPVVRGDLIPGQRIVPKASVTLRPDGPMFLRMAAR